MVPTRSFVYRQVSQWSLLLQHTLRLVKKYLSFISKEFFYAVVFMLYLCRTICYAVSLRTRNQLYYYYYYTPGSHKAKPNNFWNSKLIPSDYSKSQNLCLWCSKPVLGGFIFPVCISWCKSPFLFSFCDHCAPLCCRQSLYLFSSWVHLFLPTLFKAASSLYLILKCFLPVFRLFLWIIFTWEYYLAVSTIKG